jgi:hypothetical protein
MSDAQLAAERIRCICNFFPFSLTSTSSGSPMSCFSLGIQGAIGYGTPNPQGFPSTTTTSILINSQVPLASRQNLAISFVIIASFSTTPLIMKVVFDFRIICGIPARAFRFIIVSCDP